MKKFLFSLLLLLAALPLCAQKNYLIGKISTEFGHNLSYVTVHNVRTDETAEADLNGNFIIQAAAFDEIRFSKSGYERVSRKLSGDDFLQPLNIVLMRLPEEIEEVKITFVPTGDLKKDIAYFRPPAKVSALNAEMSAYMMTPLTEQPPVNRIPSAFAAPDYSAGQVNVVGVVGALASLIGKAAKTNEKPPNYSEVEDFYRRVKGAVNVDYYKGYGLSDYDFDIFLAYADQRFSLAKKYYRNFNRAAIESELKLAFQEYLKTFKPAS